ncbi:hypothetical protein TRIP_D300053 [uncultured Paludibacter sp.]|nr:hypothetical protein TRIP_D300053 [uncultured Paludibacter sp.]
MVFWFKVFENFKHWHRVALKPVKLRFNIVKIEENTTFFIHFGIPFV